jgi:hypothetical protein
VQPYVRDAVASHGSVAQAGRQAPKRGRPPPPSFVALSMRADKDDDLAPLVAVAKQPAAARFTVTATAVVPYALRALLPHRCDTAAARLVTLKAEGPCVYVPSYFSVDAQDQHADMDEGAVFPRARDELELQLVALPLVGEDGSGEPLRQLCLLLAEPPEDLLTHRCPIWARTRRDAPAWLSATAAGRGPVQPACDRSPSGWEAFDVFDAPPPPADA